MKSTAAPSPEDEGDLIARLDRIIELLEGQNAQTIIYPRYPTSPYVPYSPYVYPWWQVWSGTTGPNTTTYAAYNTNGVTP